MQRSIRTGPIAFLAGAVFFIAAAQANAQWGTIKGQVVWGESKIPAPEKAKVDKDQKQCLAKGDIYKSDLLINSKNKGVRYVLVWLGDPKNAKNAKYTPKIHPSLAKIDKDVVIDQPCCMFEPRVIGLREGQKLIVKNSAEIPHNFAITSGTDGPNANPLIPAGGQAVIDKFVAKAIPTQYNCSIHTWMRGYVGVFKHPYFAVTDEDGKFEIKNAPAGKVRLMVWQESSGWVIQSPADPADRGKVIDVKGGGTTDVGEIKMMAPKD